MSSSIQKLIDKARFTGSTYSKINFAYAHKEIDSVTLFKGGVGYTDDYELERSIFNELIRLSSTSTSHQANSINYIASRELDSEQNKAILSAIQNPITIINGNAGSGKTRVIKELVNFLQNDINIDKSDIVLCSMLGVVANKLQVLTGLSSFTINRLLEYQDNGNGSYIPKKNASNPINCQYLIVDEATLISNDLALALLRALPIGVRIVLAGDVGQVLSIQPGAFFTSIVHSNAFGQIHLKSNYRNKSSNIERLALDIIAPNSVRDVVDSYSDSTVRVIQTISDQITLSKLQQAISRANSSGIKVAELQVLTPIHDGILGTRNLNQLVKSSTGSNSFKVILNKTNYRLGLFNGQIGKAVIVGDEVKVNIQGKTLTLNLVEFNERFDLAYALTPHRVQGAEFDLVIVVIPYQCVLIDANWLYSAMTRTKKSLVVIGDASLIERVEHRQRRTFLEVLLAGDKKTK
ncbi:hypothetical protein GCM10011607_11490 [Shewanella inventionis]|uniref:UvrD-like helicase C-terminal domain-containing protein n=1 Tax=Shewanella inventionis TaxID=1738770 RepID=A0ABQ1IYA7_9GAMM|nr:ATP-dependent RecD-like DNA helicase [Shewanella inventionis]GGB52685.1 hypothetical protein GCM10011607_11490 [Shewanella inventionis]